MSEYLTWMNVTARELNGLSQSRESLVSRRDALNERIEEIDEEITSLQKSMVRMRERHHDEIEAESSNGANGGVDKTGLVEGLKELKGTSNIRGYEYLAENNNGLVICTEAAESFHKAGLYADYADALHNSHNTLSRAARSPASGWVRVEPGIYRFTRPTNGRNGHHMPDENADIASRSTQRPTGLCVKEQASREMVNLRPSKDKRGRDGTAGDCINCGQRMWRAGRLW